MKLLAKTACGGNLDPTFRGPGTASAHFNKLHHFKAFQYRPKNDVSTVQMGRSLCSNKELASVGIWSGVGHREYEGASML